MEDTCTLAVAIKSYMYIAINWFSDSIQNGIFIAEHQGWIKKYANELNKT